MDLWVEIGFAEVLDVVEISAEWIVACKWYRTTLRKSHVTMQIFGIVKSGLISFLLLHQLGIDQLFVV